jgi:hypothetical protein
VRAELARPNVVYKPHNAKSRAALSIYTGKKVTRKQKKVIIHTDGRETKIRVRDGVVQTVRESVNADGTKHISVQRDHYFLFKRKPKTWRGIESQAVKTVKTLPAGMYMVMSSNHGLIGVPTNRDSLLDTMQEWHNKYGGNVSKEGMAETIIGFRWVGTNYKQSDSFIKRYRDRIQDLQAHQRRRARAEQARIRRRLNKRRG